MPNIETPRLNLKPFTLEQVVTLIEEPERFDEVSEFPAATGLRDFFVSGEVDHAWVTQVKEGIDSPPWTLGFAVIDRVTNSIVGTGGFKGPPTSDAIVEIAYGIVPSFEGRGYATEVAAALTAYCFENGVEHVWAHTLPIPNASNRVLTKCGFQFGGEVNDPHDGAVWKWERHHTKSA